MAHVAAYITGHGFGHATRMAAILGAMAGRVPGLRLSLISTAPEWVFRLNLAAPFDVPVPRAGRRRHPGGLDSPERPGDAGGVRAGPGDAGRGCRRGGGALAPVAGGPGRRGHPAGGVSGGAAGRRSGVGISNFSWDWIYAAYVRDLPDRAPLRRGDPGRVRRGRSVLAAAVSWSLRRVPGRPGHPDGRSPRPLPARRGATSARAFRGSADGLAVVRRLRHSGDRLRAGGATRRVPVSDHPGSAPPRPERPDGRAGRPALRGPRWPRPMPSSPSRATASCRIVWPIASRSCIPPGESSRSTPAWSRGCSGSASAVSSRTPTSWRATGVSALDGLLGQPRVWADLPADGAEVAAEILRTRE